MCLNTLGAIVCECFGLLLPALISTPTGAWSEISCACRMSGADTTCVLGVTIGMIHLGMLVYMRSMRVKVPVSCTKCVCASGDANSVYDDSMRPHSFALCCLEGCRTPSSLMASLAGDSPSTKKFQSPPIHMAWEPPDVEVLDACVLMKLRVLLMPASDML